ncbi:MAG: HlyD family secretion protein, partial [Stellaceae bacterium]
AELQRVTNGAEPAERRAAWAAVEMAQAVEKKAGSELDRKQKLAQSAVASRAALEQAETELEVARNRAEQAQQRFDIVNGPTRADDVAIAEAKLGVAEAALKVAKAALDDTVIRSPIDGTVLRIYRHPGELVSVFVDDPVLSLGDLSALNVRAEIDEADIARVKPGQPAYVTADAYGQQRFRGHVLRLGQVLGKKRVTTGAPGEREDTKVLDALVRLDGPTPLRPGLRVDTFILPRTGDAAARASNAARYSAYNSRE